MRPADVAECAALGVEPLFAVLESMRVSASSVAILIDGHVAAVGGYRLEPCPLLAPRSAVAWVLTSGVVERHPIAFHRTVREWLAAMGEHVDVLWNQVDARHVSSLRWLERLGFKLSEPKPLGPNGALFRLALKEV